jgi:hypothetical protein
MQTLRTFGIDDSRYVFSFEQRPAGDWRAYIIDQPGYAGRPTDAAATHRLTDQADGRRYVCWTERLATLTDAMKVAEGWARRTHRYVATGRPIGS